MTGVELNPILVGLLTGRLRDYNRLARLPDVRLYVDEGRSWFARSDQLFDLIQMSMVDTWAATGAGASLSRRMASIRSRDGASFSGISRRLAYLRCRAGIHPAMSMRPGG